jgi:hypothetical protein
MGMRFSAWLLGRSWIYQIFEGTAQMQRLVIARMRVADAQSRVESGFPAEGSAVAEAVAS